MAAQYRANRQALEAALAEEESRLLKAARTGLGQQIRRQTRRHSAALPRAGRSLRETGQGRLCRCADGQRQEAGTDREGAGTQDQDHLIESARASISQSERKLAQIASDYRRQLHSERNEIQGQTDKLAQELAKQTHRQTLLELKASQDSVVKDLATHSPGTVVQPGTVLLTLVPKNDILRAEVWVSNEDIGFVRQGQPVKLKFAAFPFQKYGMVEGNGRACRRRLGGRPGQRRIGKRAGMTPSQEPAVGLQGAGRAQAACIWRSTASASRSAPACRPMPRFSLGRRTVAEYLLSPVRKAWHEAARER
jgi:hemolysin D